MSQPILIGNFNSRLLLGVGLQGGSRTQVLTSWTVYIRRRYGSKLSSFKSKNYDFRHFSTIGAYTSGSNCLIIKRGGGISYELQITKKKMADWK
jgi:hypothetical protein